MPKNWGAFWEGAFVWIVLLSYVLVALAAYRGYILFKSGNKLFGGLLMAFAAMSILLQVGAYVERK